MSEAIFSDGLNEETQAMSMNTALSSPGQRNVASSDITTRSPSNDFVVSNSNVADNLDQAFDNANKHLVEEEEVYVKMRPSAFRNIPNVVFMDYPPELKIARNDISSMEVLGTRKLNYMSYWERICIRNAFTMAGFKKSSKNWTGLWSKHQNDTQMKGLNCLQKVNHFPASWCVGRKDRLARTMQSMYRKHGNHFDFHPNSFILPSERDALHRQIHIELKTMTNMTREKSGLWIVKPCASSCGKGIQVMTGSQILALPKSKKILVQKYLSDPYCIDGNKFDLRMYVLVTGVDPLRVYVHSEGLARISTSKYSLKNIGDRFAHLTNYSVNKKSKEFKRSAAMPDDVNITEQYTQEKKDTKRSSKKKSKKADNNDDFDYDDADGEDEDDNCVDVDDDDDDDDDDDEGEAEEESNSKKDSDPEQRKYKWSLSQFKTWLAKKEGKGVMEKTMENVNDLLIKTMLAAESVITPQLHGTANYRTNCFELFGCDVMLDSKLKPHLIEVNISPSLMGGSSIDKQVKGMLMSDILHTIGLYPYDMKMMKKYEEDKKIVSGSGNAGSVLKRLSTPLSSKMDKKDLAQNDTHVQQSKVNNAGVKSSPFAFASMSKMMSSQDLWRKKPHPMNINMKSLGSNDAVWNMLLMCEDEFSRSKCTQFHLVHPNPATAIHYNSLYFNSRFSDQLLARWILQNGSLGELRSFIPIQYLPLGDERVIAAEAERQRLLNGGTVKAQLMSGNMGMKKLALASPPRGTKSQKKYSGNSIRKRVSSARQSHGHNRNRPEKNSDSSSSSGNASIASSTDTTYQQFLNNKNNNNNNMMMNMQPTSIDDNTYQDQNMMMHANVTNTVAPVSQSQTNTSTYSHTKKNLTDLRHFGISGDIRLAKDIPSNNEYPQASHGANGIYAYTNAYEEQQFVENSNFTAHQNQIPALPKLNKSSFLIRNTIRGNNSANGTPSHTPRGIADSHKSNHNNNATNGSDNVEVGKELDLKTYARSGMSFDEYHIAKRGGSSHVQNIMAQRELQLQNAMLMARDKAAANNNNQMVERAIVSSNMSHKNQEQNNDNNNFESSSVRQVHRKTAAHGTQQRSRSKPVSMSRKWI